MKLLYDEDGFSKLTELIRLSHLKNKHIVCSTYEEARMIFETSKEIGLNIYYPMTISELLSLRSSPINNLLMYKIEDVLSAVVGRDIDVATTTIKQE